LRDGGARAGCSFLRLGTAFVVGLVGPRVWHGYCGRGGQSQRDSFLRDANMEKKFGGRRTEGVACSVIMF